MFIHRAAIKQNAKLQIQAAKPHPCVVTLVLLLITWLLSYLSNKVSGVDPMRLINALEGSDYFALYSMFRPKPLAYILYIVIELVTLTLSTGFVIYIMNVSRMQAADFGNLFDGFGIFFRALWLRILMGIFVALWSLLFVIPGIIATYRYRMALYLLIDNPQMSALECIRESKRMMVGHKWELFVLDLSFLGWILLTIVPFVSLWVSPYMETTRVNYYMALLGLPENGGSQSRPFDNGTPPWEG